jgi:hypothetical protein
MLSWYLKDEIRIYINCIDICIRICSYIYMYMYVYVYMYEVYVYVYEYVHVYSTGKYTYSYVYGVYACLCVPTVCMFTYVLFLLSFDR